MLVKKVNYIDWLKIISFSTILLVLNTKIQSQTTINSKKYNFINVKPSIPAEEIIEKCIATVSMPFTSTAIIAKSMGKPSIFYDPTGMIKKDDLAAHGIEVLTNKSELNKWILNISKIY